MISKEIFESCAVRAGLAPSVHNTQPARWVQDGDVVSLFCDTDVGLTIGDPSGRDAALSCGAALEGMVLALSAHQIGVDVTLTGEDTSPGQGLVALAHLRPKDGAAEGLHRQLEQRFTWRGGFASDPLDLFGWTRPDARFVLDLVGRSSLAELNDLASFEIMQKGAFRRELVSWMRLTARHPRAGLDGMDRDAMLMSVGEARMAPIVLRRLWPLLNLFGMTKSLTAEAEITLTAPLIALFHRDKTENPIESGRAYLRLCLEASSLGLAGWPMAALSDHPATQAEVCTQFGISSDRRLIQAIRFGVSTGPAPQRARRPLAEIIR